MAMHLDNGWGWRQAAEKERKRSGFLELHITDRNQEVLTMEQRLAPDDWSRHREQARRPHFRMDDA